MTSVLPIPRVQAVLGAQSHHIQQVLTCQSAHKTDQVEFYKLGEIQSVRVAYMAATSDSPWFHANDVAAVLSRTRIRTPFQHRVRFMCNPRHAGGDNFISMHAFADYLAKFDFKHPNFQLVRQFIQYLVGVNKWETAEVFATIVEMARDNPLIPTRRAQRQGRRMCDPAPGFW